MRIRFWGTRGSIAKAGPTTVRHGGNTSCVEVRSSSGTILVVDCGTGAHGLGQSLVAEGVRRGHLLITHTHWDHIQGIPFFAPFFQPESEWHVYGPRGFGQSLQETLAGQMEYTYFPVNLDQFSASVHYHDLVEGAIRVGDVDVTARYLHHPALTLGYRFEADGAVAVYSSDHEPHAPHLAGGGTPEPGSEDEHHVSFLAGADLLIHDAQYTAEEYPQKQGWGHSTMEYVVDVALAASARRLALYHHDPMRDDAAVDGLVARARERAAAAGAEMEVFAATEGDVVDLLSPSPAQAEPPAEGAPAGGRAPEALADHTVLLAASDPSSLADLAAALVEDGLRVLETGSVEQTLELARSAQPSLVIAERGLAGGGALSLCRELRRTAAGEAPVFAVLASEEDPSDREAGRKAGVDHWLVAPYTMQLARTKARAWVLRMACHWEKAPLCAGEEERLRALHDLRVLDTEREERFDRYTRIAASLFDVPIALVSLVDRDRQWFKSRHGLDAPETPRDMAFCSHAILKDEVFVVADALHDPRFADNPLVTGGPHVRFYAGIPLRTSGGSAVGTLCLIDHRPRELDTLQLRMLRDLGQLVERELEAQPSEPGEAAAAGI